MAQVLWQTAGRNKVAQQRAHELAEQAQGDFVAYGSGPDSELEEVQAWLKAH